MNTAPEQRSGSVPQTPKEACPPTRSAVSLLVIPAPILKGLARVVKTLEPFRIQTLVPKAAVERLDVRVVDRLARSDEVDIDTAEIRPSIEVIRGELRPVVQLNRSRSAVLTQNNGSRSRVAKSHTRRSAPCRRYDITPKRSFTSFGKPTFCRASKKSVSQAANRSVSATRHTIAGARSTAG